MKKNRRPVARPNRAAWSASQLRRDRELFALALGISLYLHVLLMLLRFGDPGLGLPGFTWPWIERRVQAPQITVRLVEAPRPPAAVPASAPVPPVAKQRTPPTTVTPKQPKSVTPPRADKSFEVRVPRPADAAPLSEPRRVTRAQAPAAKARAPDRKIAAKPERQILAAAR